MGSRTTEQAGWCMTLQKVGDDSGDFGRGEHSYFDRIGRHVLQQGMQRFKDDLRGDRIDPPHARGILHGQGGDAGDSVAVEAGDRLDVGGNARAGGGIKAGYRPYHRWLSHLRKLAQPLKDAATCARHSSFTCRRWRSRPE